MTADEIADQVRAVIASTLDVDAVSLRDDMVLTVDLDVDSLAATELSLVIEDEFDIRVPQEERVDILTVGDVIATVARKLRERPTPRTT